MNADGSRLRAVAKLWVCNSRHLKMFVRVTNLQFCIESAIAYSMLGAGVIVNTAVQKAKVEFCFCVRFQCCQPQQSCL